MAVDITLSLPDTLVEHAKLFGIATQQDVESVLADALEIAWPTLENLSDLKSPSFSTLTNKEILELADSKMGQEQNERLHILQQKGKSSSLTADESYELMALLRIYQLGQLRKSEAMAEAVRLGLRKPVSS
jgi:hypothetical protein